MTEFSFFGELSLYGHLIQSGTLTYFIQRKESEQKHDEPVYLGAMQHGDVYIVSTCRLE